MYKKRIYKAFRRFLCFTLFMVLILLTSSQGQKESFRGSEDFFEYKIERYKLWLEKKGLSSIIDIETWKLEKNDTEIELILSIQSSSLENGVAKWDSFCEIAKRQFSGVKIEEVLFRTFVKFMEVPREQANIQIYIPRKDGLGFETCFYIFIWEQNDEIKVERNEKNCKSQNFVVEVEVPTLKKNPTNSNLIIFDEGTTRRVFNSIIDYANQKYLTKGIQNRTPIITVSDSNATKGILRFSVEDLSREVLTNEKKSIWCQMIEFLWGPCNDMRRERLEYTFHYVPTKKGGILQVILTGKYGSGVYKPRISGYMDMEPEFEEDFLEPYATLVRNELESFIKNNIK